jgi:glycosyltransferase involved in cell wall biosynthesis
LHASRDQLITIGIPTYNRCQQVASLIGSLRSDSLPDGTRVVVVNDGSTDGTADAVTELIQGANNFELVTHTENQGYARTYIELFERCHTEYLVIGTDDDIVLKGQTTRLRELLIAHDYDFVATQFMLNGSLYRGSKGLRRIKPGEIFYCSNHAPGLVYRVSACRDAVSQLRQLVAEGSAVGLVYPQVIVVAYMLAVLRHCYWWPEPLVVSGANLPSGLRDSSGEHYYSVVPRWKQVVATDRYFAKLSGLSCDRGRNRIVGAMRMANRRRVYGLLRTAIVREYPEFAKSFDSSVKIHALRLWLKPVLHLLRKPIEG